MQYLQSFTCICFLFLVVILEVIGGRRDEKSRLSINLTLAVLSLDQLLCNWHSNYSLFDTLFFALVKLIFYLLKCCIHTGTFIIICLAMKLRCRWCVILCLAVLVHQDFQNLMHLKYVPYLFSCYLYYIFLFLWSAVRLDLAKWKFSIIMCEWCRSFFICFRHFSFIVLQLIDWLADDLRFLLSKVSYKSL